MPCAAVWLQSRSTIAAALHSTDILCQVSSRSLFFAMQSPRRFEWCDYCYNTNGAEVVSCEEESCQNAICVNYCQPFSHELVYSDEEGTMTYRCIYHISTTHKKTKRKRRRRHSKGFERSPTSLSELVKAYPRDPDPTVSIFKRASIVELYMSSQHVMLRVVIGSGIHDDIEITMRGLLQMRALGDRCYVSMERYDQAASRATVFAMHQQFTHVLCYVGHTEPRGLSITVLDGQEIIVSIIDFLKQVNASYVLLLCCGILKRDKSHGDSMVDEIKYICREKQLVFCVPLTLKVMVSEVIGPFTQLARILTLLHHTTLPPWHELFRILGGDLLLEWWICDCGTITTLPKRSS